MKAKDFDKNFDDGKSVITHLDLSKARRLGVPRQSIIKIWLAERLQQASV
jgi:hypothetical protein